MVLILAALLVGISMGCVVWYASARVQARSEMSHRLQDVTRPAGELHTDAAEEEIRIETHRDLISLDESYKDQISRKMFVAGFRYKSNIKFFRLMLRLSLIIPLVLVLFQLLRGTGTGPIIPLLLLGMASYLGSFIVLTLMIRKRRMKIMKSMPQFFDLLVICLEAGVNFTSAIPRVVKEMGKGDALAQEFELMHHEFMAGLPFKQICDRVSRRCDVQDLSIIMNALVESEQLGSSLSSVLRVQAAELRDKLRQRAREKAHKIPVKLVFPMMLVFSTLFVISMGPIMLKLGKSIGTAKPNRQAAQQVEPANPDLNPGVTS